MVIQAGEFLCGIGRLSSIELRKLRTSNRYLSHLTISQPECSDGALLCSHQHRPCGGSENTEIWSMVFTFRKFILYNWGGETDSHETAASGTKECVVQCSIVEFEPCAVVVQRRGTNADEIHKQRRWGFGWTFILFMYLDSWKGEERAFQTIQKKMTTGIDTNEHCVFP